MTEYTLPEPDFVALSSLQSGLDKSWSASSMQAAYAAGLEAGRKAPEGWKLVPIEPTVEMWDALQGVSYLGAVDAYRNTLAVAPEYKP